MLLQSQVIATLEYLENQCSEFQFDNNLATFANENNNGNNSKCGNVWIKQRLSKENYESLLNALVILTLDQPADIKNYSNIILQSNNNQLQGNDHVPLGGIIYITFPPLMVCFETYH